jgi:hypothetical protein
MPPMQWFLQIHPPDEDPIRIPLQSPENILGYGEDCDIRIPDESVSTHHARIFMQDGDVWLEDLDSTNGTVLNGTPLTEPAKIRAGDTVEFGTARAVIQAEAAPPPSPQPEAAPGKPRPEELMALGWEKFCWLIAFVHQTLARYIPLGLHHLLRLQGKLPLQVRLCMGFVILALTSAWMGWRVIPAYWEWTGFPEETLKLLQGEGFFSRAERVTLLAKLVSGACLLTAVLAFVRHRLVYWIFKAALALYLLFWLTLHSFYAAVPSALNRLDVRSFDNAFRNEFWIRSLAPWYLALLPLALLALGVARFRTRNAYDHNPAPRELTGDRIYENLRTGGTDPRMRSSVYWSAFLFFMVFVWPFLMRGCGWEAPYGLIQGSGDPVVEMVRVTRRREQPQRRMIVNNWSPFIFERMELDDVRVLDELDQESMNTYEIAQETSGQLGEGGGRTGGWPDGMEGATVRFIRLQYSGGDWDQNMDRNSDANLLRRLNQITGFPVARDGEGLTVNRLRMFPAARKPPFVFMTGSGNIRFSQSDIQTLRWYTLEEGGMIFATHGGGNFGRNFRREISRIFPGQRLVDIPNDDPIFRAPFLFPGGAPPLWQQDGSRALGIRHEGRWVVFYHPGDMSDAWRDGHSGASPEVAEQAYRMAINVIYYAFNMYHARHNP